MFMQKKGSAQRIQNKTGRCRRNRDTQGNNRKQRQQEKKRSRIAQAAQHNFAMRDDESYQAGHASQAQIWRRLLLRHPARTKNVTRGARKHRHQHQQPFHSGAAP
jgi:hypothetical protein